MHEVGVMQSALELAEQQARAAGGAKIHRLHLRVGRLSGVVPEALRFAYEGLRAGTLAADAELEIEEVPAACWCEQCQMEFSAEEMEFECPRCHQVSGRLRRGNELDLASLEIS